MYNLLPIISIVLSRIKTIIIRNKKNIFIKEKTRIHWRANVITLSGGKIFIGKNCAIGRSWYKYHAGMPFYTTLLVDKMDAIINIGNNCRLNGVYLHAKKSISIGNDCVIASGVNIIDSNGHETYSINRTKGRDNPEEIIIGNNVWIGLNSIILKGTEIGDNSIVSAGSVIKGKFSPNTVISTQSNYSTRKLIIK